MHRTMRVSLVADGARNGVLHRGCRGRTRCLCAPPERPAPPEAPTSELSQFWRWTTQERPHWRQDRTEAMVAIAVFGVTGTASVTLVRPMLKRFTGLEGSMIDGPWSYRVASVVVISPIYATLLISFGTLAGRHRFFATMGRKILSRFIPTAVTQRVVDAFCRITSRGPLR